MNVVKRVVPSACLSLVGTLALAVLSILYIMFQTTEETAYRTGLFGAVEFRSELLSSGDIGASAGIRSFAPLCVIWGVLFVVCVLSAEIYARARRERSREQEGV